MHYHFWVGALFSSDGIDGNTELPLKFSDSPRDAEAMLLNIDKPNRTCTLHSDSCPRIPRPHGTPLKPVESLGRDGGWFFSHFGGPSKGDW